jgi:hypothetical protein
MKSQMPSASFVMLIINARPPQMRHRWGLRCIEGFPIVVTKGGMGAQSGGAVWKIPGIRGHLVRNDDFIGHAVADVAVCKGIGEHLPRLRERLICRHGESDLWPAARRLLSAFVATSG